ncbi:MAG: hypothetical protein RIU67_1873 [Actinomycetota bacterium]
MVDRKALLAVSLLLMASCGAAESESVSEGQLDPDKSATIAPASSSFLDVCTEPPRAELEAPDGWSVCADSGLTPPTDGFSFENWGGPTTSDTYSPSLAVSMFGEEAVCMDTTDGCVLYPAAQQWLDQMNAAIEGGRCEGMAVLSQRLLDGNNTPDELQVGAIATADLIRDELYVGSTIARWWASQTFPAVREPTQQTLEWSPEEIAARIVEAIENGEGATLGMYSEAGGHAVTPIAVSTDGADGIIVHLYDNNYPGVVTQLVIDRASQTWTYEFATTNGDIPAEVWSGSTGTLDLTLMKDREVPVPAPWSDDSELKGSTTITVASGGDANVGVQVDVAGTTVDSRDITSAIDGVDVYPLRGYRNGSGAVVVVSSDLGAVNVRPVVGAKPWASETTTTFTLRIDFPGDGAVYFEDEVDLGTSDPQLPTFVFEGDESDYSFDFESDGDVEINFAYDEESVDYDLNGDVDFSFDEAEGSADVELLGPDGEPIWMGTFDGTDDDGVWSEIDVSFDEESGEAIVEEVGVDAADLDANLLSWFIDSLTEIFAEWSELLGDEFSSFFGEEFFDELESSIADSLADSPDEPAPENTAADDSSQTTDESDEPDPDSSPTDEAEPPAEDE